MKKEKSEYKFMTEKQKRVYDYYKSFDDWLSPTYAQASKDLWLVPSVLFHYVTKLEENGFIYRDKQGWIHIMENALWNKIIAIASSMRPAVKFPKMWNNINEWIDLLRCAILKKKEENEEIEKLIDSL